MTRSRPRSESALTGTWFALVAQLSSALFTAAVTLFLVRALGPHGYGALTLVLSVSGLAVVAADAAVAQSTGRYAAGHLDDSERLAAVVSSGLGVKLLLSVTVAAVVVTLAGPLARAYGEPALTWPLRAVALAVVAESVFMLWLVAFQALRHISLNVRLYLAESVAEAAAIVTLVTLGAGVTGAALGRGIGYAVGAVVGAGLMARALGRRLDLRGDPASRRQVVSYARPLLINNGAYKAYTQVDVQLISALLDRAAVGIYAAPLRLLVLLNYPGQSAANAVSPRMAGPAPDYAAFSAALRWVLIYQTALVAPLVLWAEPIAVLLLGGQFRGSAVVLAAMTPYLWLSGVSVLASTTVNYLGHARRRTPVVVLSLALNVALCLLLLPELGVVGAAVALGVSYALYVPLHVRICCQSFPLPLRPQAVTLARAAVAAVAFGAVLAAVGTSDLSIRQWLLGTVLGPLAYVGALVATRELTAVDLRQARTAVRSATARLSQRS